MRALLLTCCLLSVVSSGAGGRGGPGGAGAASGEDFRALSCSFLLLGPRTGPSWEEPSQVPRLPPPVHKTKVPLAMASSLFRVQEQPSSYSQGSGPSSGSPEKGKQARKPRVGPWMWILRSSGFLGRRGEGGETGLGAIPVTDVSLRCRWARLLEAADGDVPAVKTVPGSGLGDSACRGPAALPEEAGTQRVGAREESGPGWAGQDVRMSLMSCLLSLPWEDRQGCGVDSDSALLLFLSTTLYF